jgi:benzoyl-CoA reductase/2-hydroxyglutaryl-CoA dehydratase subunit BcrC/BadD/HgdB
LDRAGYQAGLETLLGRLDEAPRPPADGRSRLMLYGPPLGPASDQVLDLLERSGGVVVTDYICTASARLRKRVPVWGTFERPFDSLAEHYLFNAPCPFMGDYGARLERMLRLSRWYRVHGLVGLNPGANPAFKADFERLSEDFYSRLFIPSLYIEDSLPLEDARGLEERVGGFIDIIGGRV